MRTRRHSLALAIGFAALPLAGVPLPAQALAPVLSEVQGAGGRPGETSRVTLSGKYLETVTALWFDHPGLRASLAPPPPAPSEKNAAEKSAAEKDAAKGQKQSSKKGEEKPAGPSTLIWEVAVDPAVPPGIYDLRVVNDLGVSAPRAFHVSPLKLLVDRDPSGGNAVDVELGTRIWGSIEAGLADRFRLKVPRKARVVVECLAERIDSRLDATLEVRDGAGRRVAFSADRLSLDPALAFDAEAGAEYTIELWDFTYGGKYPYILSISDAPRVLFVFPPALSERSDTQVTLYGWNLPGGRPVEKGPVEGRPVEGAIEPLESLAVTMPPARAASGPSGSTAGSSPQRRGAYRKTSGLLDAIEAAPPGIGVEPLVFARAAEPGAIEKEPNGSQIEAQPLPLPCELSGRFDSPGDRDWYSFSAKKGDRFEIEVESARLGAPCDPVLYLARRVPGKDGAPATLREALSLDERKASFPREEAFERKIAEAERDPETVWTAPEDGDYLLLVRNRNGRHGPNAIYRLRLRRPEPDFSLVVIHSENWSGEAATVPRGGSQAYDVLIERRGGFDGVVQVAAEDLPPGLTAVPVYLGPGESFVPLVFTAAADMEIWTGSVTVVGTATAGGEGSSPRVLRRHAACAVNIFGGSESKHPFDYVSSRLTGGLPVAVRGPAPFTVSLGTDGLEAAPGANLAFHVKVTRQDGYGEGVQLSFQGFNEKAYANGEGQRPVKATLSKDKNEQDLSLKVKSDAAYGERTVVVYATAQVEYLDRPGDSKSKKVKRRSTVVSNPVSVKVVPPFALSVPAASGRVAGALAIPFQIRRQAGADQEIEVVLELPGGAKGFSAEPVKLPKDKNEGEVLVLSDSRGGAVHLEGRLEGAVLRARMQLGGRRYDERAALPFALERVQAFDIGGLEQGKLGALRLEVRRRFEVPGDGPLALKLEVVPARGGKAASAEATLGRGTRKVGVLLDCGAFFAENVGRDGMYPLQVRVRAVLQKGEIVEEHTLTAGEGERELRPQKGF